MATLEVMALLEGTPQLMAPQTGDTYILPRKAAITPEANTNALAVTGFSLTGANAQSMVDLAGTWNTTGTPTAFKLNVTDTASNASSLLFDLQVGGSSKFKITKDGDITISDNVIWSGDSDQKLTVATGYWQFTDNGGTALARIGPGLVLPAAGLMQWSSTINPGASKDIILARDAANTLALRNGTNAQTARVYETYTDGSNHAFGYLSSDANGFNIGTTAAGTGTKRPVRIVGQSLASAEAVSALEMVQTWNTTGTPTAFKLNVTDTASNAASILMDLQVGGTPKFRVNKSGISIPYVEFSGWWSMTQSAAGGISLGSGHLIGWSSGSTNLSLNSVGGDTFLARDAANTLALRNSTNAQAFNVYSSYTDGSNYTRGAMKGASGVVSLVAESAGTGDANIDIALTPKGTGRLKVGTHSAIGAETVTGYIEIKDAGGTTRKLAVVS